MCVTCAYIAQRRAQRPDRDILLEEIANSGFEAVGRKYGVSGKAIVKWCKAYDLPTKKKDIVELYKSRLK